MRKGRKRQSKREREVARIKGRIALFIMLVAGLAALKVLAKPEKVTNEIVELVEMEPVKSRYIATGKNTVYPYNTMSAEWGSGDLEGFAHYDIPEEYRNNDGELPEIVQIYTYCMCRRYKVSYAVVLAMFEAESGYRWNPQDSGMAAGYMQIVPECHRERMERLGVQDAWNPYQNIHLGIDYLAELLEANQKNYKIALTAYRWGPEGARREYFSNGKYTCDYAEDVMERAERIEKQVKP